MNLHVYCSLAFLLLLPIVNSQTCSTLNPCGLTGGATFQEPEVLQSSNGQLVVTLSVEIAQITFEWFTVFRRTYNGSIPGPTWRIRRGDTVTVTLVNNLEVSEGLVDTGINTFRFPNITNLHTHGLHVSPKEPQDNVFVNVRPGQSYTYRYEIPDDHPAGTYWYHAHLHGASHFQLLSGLAGMLIIEDPTTGPAAMPPHLAAISCPDNCEHEVPLLFQPVLQYADVSTFQRGFALVQARIGDNEMFRSLERTSENETLADWLTDVNNGFDYQTTNGLVFPILTIVSGQRKRFRMINAGGSKTLELVLVEQNSTTPTSNCDVWEIAYDGMYLNSARRPRLGKSLINSGSRVDWIVVCNTPGTYELRSIIDPLDSCSLGLTERYDNVLLTVVVTGTTQLQTAQETTLPQRPSYVGDFLNVSDSEIYEERYNVEFSFIAFINRRKFSTDDDFRFKIPVGTIQEWHLLNSDAEDGHPFHLHTNHFQVVSYNAYTGPVSTWTSPGAFTTVLVNEEGDICTFQVPGYSGGPARFLGVNITDGMEECPVGVYVNHSIHSTATGRGRIGYVEPGEFRDVITLPPLSNITVRFMTNQFTGTLVIHCHTAVHADTGMMMVGEIVEQGGNLTVENTAALDEVGFCFPSGSPSISLNFLTIVFTFMVAILGTI